MTRFPKPTFESVKTISIYERPRKVSFREQAKPFTPKSDGEFFDFINSLPPVLKAGELTRFAAEVHSKIVGGKKVALMIGGHVVKTGLAPILIDLARRGLIHSISMNSAAAIHDCEGALFGMTSDDVEANIQDGTFGMSSETGDFINGVLADGVKVDELGYGEALGRALLERKAEHREHSILAQLYELGVPATVHVAIGTDIVHQQSTMQGDVTGEMSFRDFRLLVRVCGDLDGGVAINIGSSVIMPEVFLKAVTVARNLGLGARHLVTANFDMIQHYRPRVNVLERPTQPDSHFYNFTGHHEIMIPLFAAMLKLRADSQQS